MAKFSFSAAGSLFSDKLLGACPMLPVTLWQEKRVLGDRRYRLPGHGVGVCLPQSQPMSDSVAAG